MNKETSTLLIEARHALSVLNSATPTSLAEFSKPTRLSSVVLIDESLALVDEQDMTALLQGLLSMYTAYYMQAVALTIKVDGISVNTLLDRFSNSRSLLAMDSIGIDTITTIETMPDDLTQLPVFSMDEVTTSVIADNEMISKASNLMVGKMITVKLSGEQGTHVEIPVTAVLKPSYIRSDALVLTAKAASRDKTMKGRWHQWRSGEISFLRDYLLAMDLIKEDRKVLQLGQETDLLTRRIKSVKDSLVGIITGKQSVNSVSAMVIMSKSTASDLEQALGGKLSKSRTRQKYFNDNLVMTLVVIDPKMGMFNIYQRGIDEASTFTFSDIKSHVKGNDASVMMDMLKSYQTGSAVQF